MPKLSGSKGWVCLDEISSSSSSSKTALRECRKLVDFIGYCFVTVSVSYCQYNRLISFVIPYVIKTDGGLFMPVIKMLFCSPQCF